MISCQGVYFMEVVYGPQPLGNTRVLNWKSLSVRIHKRQWVPKYQPEMRSGLPCGVVSEKDYCVFQQSSEAFGTRSTFWVAFLCSQGHSVNPTESVF